MLKKLQMCVVIIFSFLLSFKQVFAKVYFEDNFSSSLDNWSITSDNPNYEIGQSGGFLTLQSNNGTFPLLSLKNDDLFPTQSSVLEIKFRYLDSMYGVSGDGIAVGYTNPENNYPFLQYGIWKDWANGTFFMSNNFQYSELGMCAQYKPYEDLSHIVIKGMSFGTGWHVLKIRKHDNYFYVYIDESLIFTSVKNICTPKNLLLGGMLPGSADWNSIVFDYVKIYDEEPNVVPANKIIILPGLGASWNERAMVFNQAVGITEWKMTPFVKNYDNLVNALKQQGKDVLVWNYDWRRPVEEIKSNLNTFINNNVGTSEKVDLVGHSLGGLVARVWGQDNNPKMGNIITLGSPHDGAVSAYDAWSGGKVSDKFDAAGIAMNILLQLNRKNTNTTVETIHNYSPVVGNLLPDFYFLKDKTGAVNKTDFNSYLKSKNQSMIFTGGWINPVAGIGQLTKEWIILGDRTIFEKMLGIWPEGVPTKYENGEGDGTVLKKSASFAGQDFYQLASNHGDIPDKSINYVLTTLGMNTVPVVVSNNNLENKLVFYIGSPAEMNLTCGIDNWKSSDFLVVDVKNYQNCQLKLVGKSDGTYHLVYGLTNNENSWGYVENEIKNNTEQLWKFDVSQNNLLLDSNGIDLKALISREIEALKVEYPKNKLLLSKASDNLNSNRWVMLSADILGFRNVVKESKRTDVIFGYLKIIMSQEYLKTGKILAGLANEKMKLEKLAVGKAKSAMTWNAQNYLKFVQYADEVSDAWKNNDYPRVMAASIVADAYYAGVW